MEGNLILMGVLFGCLALSFFLSGMEAGVFALSRLRIRQQMRAGRKSARLLYGYLEGPENFLWTILAGNTVANVIALGLVIVQLHQWLVGRPLLFVAAMALMTLVFYVFGDLLPKMLFRMFPNRLCLLLVRPFRFVALAISPLVALMDWCSRGLLRWTGGKAFTGHLFGNREELRLVMQESAQVFTSEERGMINRVLDLQNLTLRQATLPMAEAVCVDRQTPMREVLRICREKNLTRLPVWEGEGASRRVCGIVSLKTLLYAECLDVEKPAGDHVRPALYLEEDLRLEVALDRMQRSGQRLAIVLGHDRRELGIVSLQDMLKAVFGEVTL